MTVFKEETQSVTILPVRVLKKIWKVPWLIGAGTYRTVECTEPTQFTVNSHSSQRQKSQGQFREHRDTPQIHTEVTPID